MTEVKEELVYSGNVIEFVAVANEVSVFIEQADRFSKSVFIEKSRKILPLLYYKAGLLPCTEAFYEEATEKFVTEQDWLRVHDIILKKLGRHNDYPELYDPVLRDTEDKVGGSIAENMADIYQDIKDFLLIYRLGTVELMNDAIWECVQHFEQSWGQKLLNTLRVLHSLVYQGGDLADDEDEIIFTQRKKLWREDD